ncbi:MULTISPECIES: hypothetical protein [unclassified Wolbachia]|uniref:hypothetical protein n=1 Tax=unclassified Wolbachia TaxID=2640676 RepID=UPI001FEAA8E4|nr:hypothetical protein [Wolbachia endosymbiont of Leptopilina clavipes]
MGDSNEKVDYTELSKSSISDKIKPKKRSHFVSKSKLKKLHSKEKKEHVNDTKKRKRNKNMSSIKNHNYGREVQQFLLHQ